MSQELPDVPPQPQSAEPRSNCRQARVNLREPAALWLLPVREPARRFGLVDYYRLARWVAHLDQLADAPNEGIRFCQFVEQLAEAMRMRRPRIRVLFAVGVKWLAGFSSRPASAVCL